MHEGQFRKGTNIPYISHLIGVAAIVLEAVDDKELAIGALLHDSVEDQAADLADIRRLFGDRVATIVQGCTAVVDEDGDPSAESMARKDLYLQHLWQETNPDVLRVSVADKLHNASAILSDYRLVGDQIWQRFNVSKEQQLEYYVSLVEIFEVKLPGDPQVLELRAVLDELLAQAAS